MKKCGALGFIKALTLIGLLKRVYYFSCALKKALLINSCITVCVCR